MPILMFGPMVFQASSESLAPISEIGYSIALETDQQEADEQKPSTYIKNVELATLAFTVTYCESLNTDPRHEWGRWASVLNEKKPYPLILGGKPLGSDKWLLVGVEASELEYIGDTLIRAVLTIAMDEYVRPGKKEVKTSGDATTGKALPPKTTNAQIAEKAKNLLSSKSV